MRLLKRDPIGGISFTKDLSEDELPKYDILSHTWGPDEEEVTYDDITKGIGTSKAGLGSIKLNFCIEQTARDDLQYFWVDTCCIDKRNQAELAKSLISMYRWYGNAAKCYVYLTGFPLGDTLHVSWEKDFGSHRWFQRGWTLQELLAPANVEFFSRHGHSLGTKQTLEKQISKITNIPAAAIRGHALSKFTILERRRWQQSRKTREPEDIVYSLLGLLDVSMPVLYGEGEHQAWHRLEAAIESRKGFQRADFSINFSLGGATKTQHFLAREDELREIRDHLTSNGERRCVVLHGLGGIGKTQLAIEYALRHKDDYSAVFWLNASSQVSILTSFVKMAKQILRAYPKAKGVSGLDLGDNLDLLVDGVKAWLSIPKNNQWLLICDNYDNPKVAGQNNSAVLDIQQYLPEAHQGYVIMTTRSTEVRLDHCLRVTKFRDWKHSLQLLEQSADRVDSENGCDTHVQICKCLTCFPDNDAVRLVKTLDGLPLAIATAGAFLRESAMTYSQYLMNYKRSWARLQEMSPRLPSYEDRTLFSTWQVSFDRIKQINSTASHLLRLWAYLDNRDLWFELLDHTNDESPQWMKDLVQDELAFEACVRILCNHGLVEPHRSNKYNTETSGYSVHACVHYWMSTVLNFEVDKELAKIAGHCVATHVPDDRSMADWPLVKRRLLPHVERVKEVAMIPWACHRLGRLYSGLGKLKSAEDMYTRELRGLEATQGSDHTLVMDAVNNLGYVYRLQGDLERSEQMFMRALKGREAALGTNHEVTLNVVNNIALLYSDQGRLREAKEMCMRALAGKEKVLGPDHPSTLTTVNNLGIVYRQESEFELSERMFNRALEGREKAIGTSHPSTLTSAMNLGILYAKQERLVEAEGMFRRALEGRQKALGADHILTLSTVICVSNLRIAQGKLDEAETLYLRVKCASDNLTPKLRRFFDELETSITKLHNGSSREPLYSL